MSSLRALQTIARTTRSSMSSGRAAAGSGGRKLKSASAPRAASARAGSVKHGMPSSRSRCRGRPLPPVHTTTMGRSVDSYAWRMSSISWSAPLSAFPSRTAIMSVPGCLTATCRLRRSKSGSLIKVAVRSMGFLGEPNGGMTDAIRCCHSGSHSPISIRWFAAASAISTPAPPESDSVVSRLPRGGAGRRTPARRPAGVPDRPPDHAVLPDGTVENGVSPARRRCEWAPGAGRGAADLTTARACQLVALRAAQELLPVLEPSR